MMKTSISTIMSGKPPKGINKYMLEEVFFSESCKLPDEYARGGGNNPQNARFVDGKYYFNYPELWYNNSATNKAIALRKIDLNTGSLNLKFDVVVKRTQAGQTNPATRKYTLSQSVKPNQSTSNILENIARTLTNAFSARNNGNMFRDTPLDFVSYYDYKNQRALLKLQRDYTADPETHYFSWYIENLNEDAKHFFNIEQNPIQTGNPHTNKDGKMEHAFNHIWNREFLFVHASFVNGTSFNYLGRSGEFYTKPSKMYRFGGAPQQFYFELSFDGRNPIRERFGEFCIDLAFIYHDKDYQAE